MAVQAPKNRHALIIYSHQASREPETLKSQSHEATLLAPTAIAATGSRLVAKCGRLVVTSKSDWQLKILAATKVKHVQLCSPGARDYMIT